MPPLPVIAGLSWWMTDPAQYLLAVPGTHRVAPGQLFVLERLDAPGHCVVDTFSLEQLDPEAHAEGAVGEAVVAFARFDDAEGVLRHGGLRLPCGLPVSESCQVTAVAPESLLSFGGLMLLDAMGQWRLAPWHPGCYLATGVLDPADLLVSPSPLPLP